MLGLFGLLGLLVAGSVGGLLLSPQSESDEGAPPQEDSDLPPPDEPASGETAGVAGLGASGHGPEAEASADVWGISADGAFGRADDLPPPVAQTLPSAGGAGDLQLFGAEGNDLLQGGAGHDSLQGLAGNDTLLGGGGNDILRAGSGANWLSGGAGDDLLVAGPGDDTLDGDDGNDTLIGNDGRADAGSLRYLNGGRGEDLLHLGGGDVGSGGSGADLFVLNPGNGPAQIMDLTAEDQLVLEYPASDPPPEITYRSGAQGLLVLADGAVLAELAGISDPGQVMLRLSAV